MASMATSDLVAIGQGGTTIGLGLLVGTTSAQPTDADRTDTDRSHSMRAIMSVSGWTLLGTMVVVAGVAVAGPAHADPDTDFANELHTYGIYGQKDYNAWIGKIT